MQDRPESDISHTFASVSSGYRRYRPDYPAELFAWLTGLCEAHDAAWDAACGSGQASVLLAPHFAQVFATDASSAQIEKAANHERIAYSAAPVEACGLADNSVDLILAAQAAHWFDQPRFYDEVRRVGRPGAPLALIGYGLLEIEPEVDRLVRVLFHDVVGGYWASERRHVEARYRSLPFPFAEIEAPDFHMVRKWTLEHLLGYLATWSAVTRFKKATGNDPLENIAAPLKAAWGDETREVRWPLFMRIGNIQA